MQVALLESGGPRTNAGSFEESTYVKIKDKQQRNTAVRALCTGCALSLDFCMFNIGQKFQTWNKPMAPGDIWGNGERFVLAVREVSLTPSSAPKPPRELQEQRLRVCHARARGGAGSRCLP